MAGAISGSGEFESERVSSVRDDSRRFAFALVTALFFIFGFITCLNDILVPHLKAMFTLDYTRAALVQFCFFSAYFFMSLPSGKIVSRMGYKRGTMLGLGITAMGCLFFYPAAGVGSYALFLIGLFILASGVTLLQVAVNPYIAVLGPKETASSRLNLSQAFNSLGTTLAPMFGSYLILSSGVDPRMKASAVQGPYLGLALALIALALVVHLVRLPDISKQDASDASAAPSKAVSAWRYRHLVFGAVGIFCYVGAEVAIGSYLINFMGLPEIAGYSESVAGRYVSFYWGGAMIGRFIGSVLLRKIRPARVLAFNAFISSALVLIAMIAHGQVALLALLGVGFFNSIMFPTIFTLAIEGLGAKTAQGSGILCMAIVGGALIPLAQGWLADQFGLHHSFVLPVICYGYIVYYGMKGHRTRFTERLV